MALAGGATQIQPPADALMTASVAASMHGLCLLALCCMTVLHAVLLDRQTPLQSGLNHLPNTLSLMLLPLPRPLQVQVQCLPTAGICTDIHLRT